MPRSILPLQNFIIVKQEKRYEPLKKFNEKYPDDEIISKQDSRQRRFSHPVCDTVAQRLKTSPLPKVQEENPKEIEDEIEDCMKEDIFANNRVNTDISCYDRRKHCQIVYDFTPSISSNFHGKPRPRSHSCDGRLTNLSKYRRSPSPRRSEFLLDHELPLIKETGESAETTELGKIFDEEVNLLVNFRRTVKDRRNSVGSVKDIKCSLSNEVKERLATKASKGLFGQVKEKQQVKEEHSANEKRQRYASNRSVSAPQL